MEILTFILGGAASFIGSYSALKIHLHYVRRDVDHAHKRIDRLEEAQHVF